MSGAELEADSSEKEHSNTTQSTQRSSTATTAESTTSPLHVVDAIAHESIDTITSNNNSYDELQHINNHSNMQQFHQLQQQQQEEQLAAANNGLTGLGLTLMQSSPPPHSYRHSRAYRHFKNPPQPHMCIRTTTEAGEELFINVLSWTRIVIPQEPSDPIPLYGGMRVPPGSPRSPPIVFAVMANPEVLKDSGRHSKDPEERRAMVELMCDFVEAMNPGVKLVRNAIILKDRDISGELKDVWNAVQAQRDREREEQMLQQRQQQHFQNLTTQQLFPKSPDAARAATASMATTGAVASTTTATTLLTAADNHLTMQDQVSSGVTLAVFAQQLDNKVVNEQMEQSKTTEIMSVVASDECVDQTDAVGNGTNSHLPTDNHKPTTTTTPITTTMNGSETDNKHIHPTTAANTNGVTVAQQPVPISTPTTTTTTTPTTTPIPQPNQPTSAPPPAAQPAVQPAVQPAKKEKLGGFLPNGCIFPRFKNNKHKDKDSNNHKESKSKEKTLLNALKKSNKDKKVAPIEQPVNDKNLSTVANTVGENVVVTTTQYEKNCINNLECEVQKLDLNSSSGGGGGGGGNNDNNTSMFIKLAATAAK